VTAPTPAPAAAPIPATVSAQPPLVPSQGTVGSGRVDLVGVIFFAHGSSALDGRDAQVLAQIAQLHKQYGGIVRIIGNASARTGTLSQAEHDIANFEVSMERGGAVAAKLSSYGVASTSIIVEARSDSQPIYHEFMPTGEAGNRRAEIYLEY
jgi:flagellar motor protein MotB